MNINSAQFSSEMHKDVRFVFLSMSFRLFTVKRYPHGAWQYILLLLLFVRLLTVCGTKRASSVASSFPSCMRSTMPLSDSATWLPPRCGVALGASMRLRQPMLFLGGRRHSRPVQCTIHWYRQSMFGIETIFASFCGDKEHEKIAKRSEKKLASDLVCFLPCVDFQYCAATEHL